LVQPLLLKNNATWSFELLLVLAGAGLAQSVQQQAMGWMGVLRFPAGARDFSLLHRVQTRSWAHLVSYPMGIRGSFPRGKAGCEAAHSPTSSGKVTNGGDIPPLPHMSSWHGAY
jgi:hypothetical protein